MATPGNGIPTSDEQSNLRVWKDPDAIRDLKDVLFDFDTHESASEQAILEANAHWLQDHPDVKFKLAGYTDPRDDLVYNLALSQRRAETIKQELIRMGGLKIVLCLQSDGENYFRIVRNRLKNAGKKTDAWSLYAGANGDVRDVSPRGGFLAVLRQVVYRRYQRRPKTWRIPVRQYFPLHRPAELDSLGTL